MDEKYREAAADVFEEARTNVDILLRAREEYDGTLPFDMNEIITYIAQTFPGVNQRVQQHLSCDGGKECFEENMPWLTELIKRGKSVSGSSQ